MARHLNTFQASFTRLSETKLKEGVFVGPDIRKLIKDNNLGNVMNDVERSAWNSFKDVVTKFLGNQKDPDFENIVKNMLCNFKNLGCSMSFKLHFLNSHLDYFPENLGAVSEEQGERFHQDINGEKVSRSMGYKYDGRLLLDAA